MLVHLTTENTMIAGVKSFLLYKPSRTSEFTLVTAFSIAGLVLSMALAFYGLDFAGLL
jgi:hypothetical protein